MAKRLDHRVALVTGASSGIGEATALALAEAGAKVAIAARRRDRLDELATRLRGLGAEPLVLEADLLNEHVAQRIVADTEAHFGRLDILVNNAGVMYLEPVIEADLGRFANPNGAAYSATKFGVVAFSEALRREVYQDQIRVSVIEPGLVATELRDHIGHAAVKDAINAWADGMRQLQPDDVAEVILFCVTRPPHVSINEVLMRPTDQER